MRRNRLYLLVALLLASAARPPSAAAQGLTDVRPVKPLMMLLVDTSGSMEYMPDTLGSVDALPNCTNTASDLNQKNRWAVTIEALTGTMPNFRCVRRDRSYYNDFDKSYYLPHFELSGTPSEDGVLDAFRDRLKFGLMTFDGVLTTVGGRPLEPFSSYDNDTYRADLMNTAGMWSYPTGKEGSDKFGWMQLYYPGCPTPYGVNAGARGEGTKPGSLISVGASDSGSAVTAVNTSIQTSLLGVRPYAGTPIAALLDDFRYYMQKSDDVHSLDAYRNCRKRYAVLLTDGAPDKLFRNEPNYGCETLTSTPDGTMCEGVDCCPYDPEETIAESLVTRDGLDKLWVVAFNVNDQAGLAKLNQIASKGGTNEAIQVLTASTLRSTLSRLMSESGPDATSRSVPVVVNTGRAVMLGGKQYEISAGFRVGTFDEPWDGFLYRRRITCEGITPSTQTLDSEKGDMFHDTLNKRSGADRQIETIAPPVSPSNTAQGSLFATTATAFTGAAPDFSKVNVLRPDGTSFTVGAPANDTSTNTAQATTATGQVKVSFDKNLSPVYFGDADGNNVAGETTDRNKIHDYLRGISSNRISKKLGDIYHSNPVVMPPVAPGSDVLNSFDPQLREFYKELYTTQSKTYPSTTLALQSTGYYGSFGRPGVVFVGTNDGILHAFSLDDWPNSQNITHAAGKELWGFVPPSLFDKLASASAPTHQMMFDGTPVVKDVIYKRVLSSSTATTAMGTVLVAAVGGAASYVAIDVTYPELPKFLWQLSFKNLGLTVGTPAIGHAKLKWGSETHLRAVAILPGGEGEETSSTSSSCPANVDGRGIAPGGRENVRCWKLRGRSLYVVDVATGELIQEFDGRHFASPLSGAVALDSDNEPLSQTRGAYFTDADGVLWRLWMNNPDPSKWRVAPIWDVFAGTASLIPSTSPSATDGAATSEVNAASPSFSAGHVSETAPLLNRDKNGNLTIIVGTGDVDNLIDTVPHRVVSLKESRYLDSAGELTSASKIEANWKLQLENGEGVTGPLSVFEDTLYFASFKAPPANATDLCEIGSTRIVGVHVREKAASSSLPKARLRPESSGTGYVLYYYPSDEATRKSLLLGLSITQDPVCVAGTPETDPLASGLGLRVSGKTGGGEFRLRSMVAGGSGGSVMSGSTATGFGGLRQVNRAIVIPNVATAVGWASSIE